MALASYVIVSVCVSITLQLVYCNDIFLVGDDGPFRFVSEDAGVISVSIASISTQDREAYIFFHDNNTYFYTLYGVPVHYAIAGVDFEFQTITDENRYFDFTIPAGDTRSFQMTIIDDTIAEVFSADFIEYDLGIYDDVGERVICQQQVIYIEDNDGLRFEVEYEGFSVDEDVGSTELCVSYRGDNVPSSVDATIPDTYGDGDLVFSEINFTISTGSRRCFDVIILDDDEIERTEYFGFNVHLQTGVDPHFSDFTQINIIDDEAFRIGFERSTYTVQESDELLSVCVTADRGDGSETYLVNVTSIDLTAQGDEDYEALQMELIISAELGRQCANISIIDDTVIEENESFQITLLPLYRSIDTLNEVLQVDTDLVTVMIIDDDLSCDPDCVNGECIFPGLCQCEEGWIDVDCSQEICQLPCVNGTCNINTGYCDCSPGFTGVSCDEDVLECVVDNGGCEQLCTDFPGGYSCSCAEGYRPLTPEDGSVCEDIPDCEEEDNDCEQICVETPGSYYCNCKRGFQIVNRTKCEDIDECSVLPNGLCHQLCNNTEGSYHCYCREGYRLFRKYLCQDVDECDEMSDKCNKTESAPATCINNEGSYRCSCDQRTGYVLSSDGKSCQDVNECEEDNGLCAELCINTAGSYMCDCPIGLVLDEHDRKTCRDIDECETREKVCQHTCMNTFGSFNCGCKPGFQLLDDGFTCEALRCPQLDAPLNGNISCDNQSVGETCTFSCNEGYLLTGMSSRNCTSSLQWTEGRPTMCDPPMCDKLLPPSGGFVLFPCTREEGDSCSVMCVHGYSTSGPTNQMCEKNSSTDILVWSNGPQCEESDTCSPNPCLNGGVCTRDGDKFSCDCKGTGYGGQTCQGAIVYFEYIPPIIEGTRIAVNIYTNATMNETYKITASVHGPQRFNDTVGLLLNDVNQLTASKTLRETRGVLRVELTSTNNTYLYEPQERSVFVSANESTSNTFTGQLKPSCCTSDPTNIVCPASTQTISLLSYCQWETNNGVIRTVGIVFANTDTVSLPISVSGMRYGITRNKLHVNNFVAIERECIPCESCMNEAYNFTLTDTINFLNTRALAYTYLEEIQKLLPSWLTMSVDVELAMDTSSLTLYDSFAPITRDKDTVSSKGCSKLSHLTGSVYSVLRHDKTLSAVIDGHQYDYRESTATGSASEPMCFALDLCKGSESPVHMQISPPINDILVSEYLDRFNGRQWNIHFNNISVYGTPVSHNFEVKFWNGNSDIEQQDIEVDVSVNVDIILVFINESLNLMLEFSGDAAFNYKERLGSLDGRVVLMINSFINGSVQNYHIHNSNTEAYFHITDGDPCNSDDQDLRGVSFTASYEQQLFFSNLFPFNITTQKCSLDVFIPIDSNYEARGLSLHTVCPLFALDELVFPGMSHTVKFIESSNPHCFPHNTLGVTDAALVIESELISDHLSLGNILQLQPAEGPDITTVFGRNTTGFVSQLYAVSVALFSGTFTSGATIRNNQLEITTDEGRIFNFPAEMFITAFANEAEWDELEFTVKGNLLNGEDSFIGDLSAAVETKLARLAALGESRFEIAQMSFNQSTERLNTIREQFNNAGARALLAQEQGIEANQTVNIAREKLMKIEQIFDNSQDELQEEVNILENNCTEEDCIDVCMAGEVCRNCSRPIFIAKTSKCPITVNETRRIRILPYFEKTITWRFVLVCRSESTEECAGEGCPVGSELYCYGKCVPVVDSLVPVYHWKTVEVEVETYETCTITVFNATVLDTCCENNNCVTRVPNATCVINNAMCRAIRQNASENIANIRNESRELFQQLQEARKNLSLARTAARMHQVEFEIFMQRSEQLEMSINNLEKAHSISSQVYNRTLDGIGPLLRISKLVQDGNFFKVISVTFNATISRSPKAIELNVRFEKQDNDGNCVVYEESYVYVASHGKQSNLERIADGIIDSVFFEDSEQNTRLQSRVRRQVTPDTSQREIFASRCAHVANTELFFEEIQTKLTEIQFSIEASREGTTLSQSLSDQDLLGDEEFAAYVDLIRSYEDLSMEALRALESTIFSEWQASMEFLYSESASVGEFTCEGFADCLQTAVDELQNLISLTPDNEQNEEFIELQSSYSMAVDKLLELALFSNLSISEGLERVTPIIEITNAYARDNYWCSEPPVLSRDPPPEVNVSLGGTLRLSCEANSSLAVTYEWRRDGNVLPQFTSSDLVIATVQRMDSANYTCFANNPVGSAESVTTSVTVYELPEFYLLPESVVTYFGDDNGAWFACNASAWPYPGWRWFHRNTADHVWTLIEGEETNELLILNPQEEHEGVYMCEAYNYHGSIHSDAVTLTLLPFTVSQQQYTVEFSVFMNASGSGQSGKIGASGEGQSYCSLDDLYDAVYSLLSENIDEQLIEDFNVTQVDTENYDVSLNLLSTNVTTHYLHLVTFAEMANLALPEIVRVRRNVELITDLLDGAIVSHTCLETEFSIVEDSLTVGTLTYVCPPGQKLNSDYLLCLSCERGQFSSETERSRIVNGVSFSENVPICKVCPRETYVDELGSIDCQTCPKYHGTLSTGAVSIEECLPQPLLLECDVSSTSDHVTIDCKTNRPPQKTLCSFNNGLRHPCSYPVAINRDVSPLGNHSLTISVEDDEGFQAETTVLYFLEDDSKPTVPAIVPPLYVAFINDSPRVLANSVEADILLSRPVQSLVCKLKGISVNKTEAVDCSNSHVVFSALSPGVYTLRVVATNRKPDKEFIKSRFEITNDPTRCTLHLINSGVTVTDDSATVEFAGRGPAAGYQCYLDKMKAFACSSPVVLRGLSSGRHQLKILPLRCGKNRVNLKTYFYII